MPIFIHSIAPASDESNLVKFTIGNKLGAIHSYTIPSALLYSDIESYIRDNYVQAV